MHDELGEVQQAQDDEEDVMQGIGEDADYLLQDLVLLANEGLLIGITVTIGGTTITGNLIGGKSWFEEFTAQFDVVPDDRFRASLKERFGAYADIYKDEGKRTRAPFYIHLQGAKVVEKNGMLPNQGMLWRGRLSEISGFALGSLS
ncbi:gas vesicle protein [Xanthomonas campestris]|uniref:gas vesicle protein n=1 Tax=Xanthomonas campestris TaxID=339 RepID=UPI000E327285|nr:gas vesicle protein [Xanthomonas campestris]RFF46222.1 gas vesicle protein [Xanthomonas campestris]